MTRRSPDLPIGVLSPDNVLGGQPLAVEKVLEASAEKLPEYPILDVLLSLEKAQVKIRDLKGKLFIVPIKMPAYNTNDSSIHRPNYQW